MSTGAAGGGEQEIAERAVEAMLARDAFSAWLGVRLLEVRPKCATVGMTVRAEMLNGFGVCHGGIAYSLADSALAFASNTTGRMSVSVENSIAYPVPVREGDLLTAVAEEESAGRRVAFYRVTVRNQEDATVALFRGTVYRTGRSLLPGQVEDE